MRLIIRISLFNKKNKSIFANYSIYILHNFIICLKRNVLTWASFVFPETPHPIWFTCSKDHRSHAKKSITRYFTPGPHVIRTCGLYRVCSVHSSVATWTYSWNNTLVSSVLIHKHTKLLCFEILNISNIDKYTKNPSIP